VSAPNDTYGNGRRVPRDRDIWKSTAWLDRLLFDDDDIERRQSLPPGVYPTHPVASGSNDALAGMVLWLARICEEAEEGHEERSRAVVGEMAWNTVRMGLDLEGYADRDLVADLARLSPIPEDLRDYVVALLTGEVKRPAGPRRVHLFGPAVWGNKAKLFDRAWAFRVVRWKRAFKREKARTRKSLDPYRSALAKVSDESGISEDALDRWLYPRGNVTPPKRVAKLLRTSYDPPS